MQFSNQKNVTRWILIAASFVIITLILWNTYNFFQIFKNEERIKMEHWAEAQKTLLNADENTEIELPFKIINHNKTIPIILTSDKDSVISTNNIEDHIKNNPKEIELFLANLKKENDPMKNMKNPEKWWYLLNNGLQQE